MIYSKLFRHADEVSGKRRNITDLGTISLQGSEEVRKTLIARNKDCF